MPNAITSGTSGTFRIGGEVTGLSLVAGTDYYIGTAGALTSTPPVNARYMGRANSSTSLIVEANPPPHFFSPTIATSLITPAAGAIGHAVCQGRLTLTTAVPVTTADVTGATTVYFTPYLGNNIGLYDGSTNWTILPFTEISIALGTLTSGLPYDIFAYNNAGVVTLRSPVAWTNTTTRATALVLQNGIYVKTGATTDRYLGTFYTTSTTETEDSAAKRYLWNYYNRVPRELRLQEATATWAYTTATWRQARATATNQVELVIGVAEVNISLSLSAAYSNSTANIGGAIAIGEDSTTTPLDTGIGGDSTTSAASANAFIQLTYMLTRYPAAGRHVYVWLEFSVATGAGLFMGNGGQTGNTHVGGIIGQTQG